MNIKNNKKENEQYLKEFQKFLDLTDNIQDEKLRKKIIYQMLTLEKLLKNE